MRNARNGGWSSRGTRDFSDELSERADGGWAALVEGGGARCRTRARAGRVTCAGRRIQGRMSAMASSNK